MLKTWNKISESIGFRDLPAVNIFDYTSEGTMEKAGRPSKAAPPRESNSTACASYRSKNFCNSNGSEVFCSTSIARILAFCGDRLSAITAPASLSVLPPPLKP